ncbi:hypothetical protein EDM22_01715 [Agromyces tardus]|uniref:SRPBCC family protein n=2 Tax=Agromyces tardus TaxID=2583849 RepID=A0A3M8AMK9_9MICO|nr:hypothetical protein EDM22_01715 [Agromyces tardus]
MRAMTTIERHEDVRASRERVFELIADLHGYDRWLPSSGDYRGTSEISPPPVRVGTTYRETSPSGVRTGVVTALDPPREAVFRQPMALRPRFAGTIDSTVTMRVSEPDASTGTVRVTRLVELGIPRRLALLRGIVVRRYAAESERMLRALASVAED